MNKITYLSFAVFLAFAACNKHERQCAAQKNQFVVNPAALSSAVYTNFPEGFEAGTKTSYSLGTVTLPSGTWSLDNALIGTLATDRKVGAKSVRIQATGKLTMTTNVTTGATQVSIAHAVYGTDAASTWQLWRSTNNGTTWTQVGATITTSSTTLTTATFNMTITGSARFEVRKLTGGRMNIDNFSITNNPPANVPTKDNNMALGNPSNATTATSNPNNYLLVRDQYTLSYNNSLGRANWVSWHLSTAWKGSALYCGCFLPDTKLPSSFTSINTNHYTGSAFDRGHICPSEDRDLNDSDNIYTFRMTNITPQAPNLNQQTWNYFEQYCRSQMYQGKELYIIAGGSGSGGSGSNGGTSTTIGNGNVKVPANYWKIAVILPVGSNDLSRIDSNTRVIALMMPNTQTVMNNSWGFYRTSVDAIETATGYNFLSLVPTNIQNFLEAKVDNGSTN